MLQLKNPHSVLAALKERPQDVSRIVLTTADASDSDAWGRVARLAKQSNIPVTSGTGGDARRGSSGGPKTAGGRLGSSEAWVAERAPVALEELFQGAKERASGKGLWLALDSLQDPQNVGAVFRTAAFFGVQGIIVTQERSAPLSSAVYDVASGGMEFVPFVFQVNLKQALEFAKEAGVWVLGTSEHAHDPLTSIERDRPWLAVLGNEERGMRRLTEETCDVLCQIKPLGQVHSLNVSVAAGVVMSRLSE